MSTHEEYDWVVIGGGSAGYAAARTGSSLGLKTAVIEGGKDIGGLCILRGCMPSKTLLESANRFWSLRRAAEFGLRAENLQVHAKEIIARKRRLIGEFADYRAGQLGSGKFAFLRGKAHFVDSNTVVVQGDAGEQTVRAKAFLISSGSIVAKPPIPGLEEAGYLTSDQFLDQEKLPASAIVLGGGAVALEAAYYWNALGVRTTVIQRSAQVLRDNDRDAADAVTDALRKQGMQVICGTQLQRVELQDGKKVVFFKKGEEIESVAADEILFALGREPATASLSLDSAGVVTERGRVVVNAAQQTNVPHLFAAGDVCGPYEVVHIAIQQGEVAARNAAKLLKGEPVDEKVDYRLKVFGLFTSPQMATCGCAEWELQADGREYRVARYSFSDHGKSLVMGEVEGFVKLMADAKTNEILGGAVVGPEAVELIHEIVVAMRFHATARDLAGTPHYHPTLSEIWTYPAEELGENG